MGGAGHLWATALLWGKRKELSKACPGHGCRFCVGLGTRGTFAKGFNPAWNSRAEGKHNVPPLEGKDS